MYYSSGHGKGSEAVRETMGPEGKFVNADLHDYILNIFYSKQVVLYTDKIQYLVSPPPPTQNSTHGTKCLPIWDFAEFCHHVTAESREFAIGL